ncbi:MAG: hypothetical protein HQK73_10845 [Desulfamplus sp.]|nr:hypothetical protein [Desulfamplus sp.]
MMKNREIKTEYKKNPASLQNRFCYTGEEINEYINGTILPAKRAEISLHLNIEKCSRCRQLFTLIASSNYKVNSIEDFDGKDQNFTKYSPTEYTPTEQKIFERIKSRKKRERTNPVPFNIKNRVERGQIWTTSPKPKNMQGQQLETVEAGVPVLIVDNGNGDKKLSNIIRVMPLSFDTDFHKEGETFCFNLSYNSSNPSVSSDKPPHSNPLGYPFLVEIFNERPMLAGNLSRFRSIVSKADMDMIDGLLKQYRYGEDTNRIGDNFAKGKDAINRGRDENNTDSYLDISEQERLEQIKAWQQKERELCEYLTLPANESLQDEDDIAIIKVSEYKRAADGSGLSRIEEKQILIDNDDYRFVVIQKQEKIILRFDSSTIKPDSILIDGNAAEIQMSDYGEYDVEIGNARYLPEKIAVILMLDEDSFEFQLTFNHKD